MAGATINNPPLAFNPFAYRPQTYANFSPATLYVSPLEDYTAADLTSDSAPSPGSPVSPMFAAPYALPMDNDWLSWGDKVSNNNAFVRPNDPYDSPILSSVPARSVSVSPAINPLDLTNNCGVVPDDIVPFGQDGLNDNIPLFQTAPIVSSRQQQQQQTVIAPAQIQIKQEPQQQQPEPRRSARASQQQQQQRKLKRKSTASSASSRSSASPPPAASRRKDAACTSTSPPAGNGVLGPKKTAHNMIEKRYRTNLNDKIAALRDAVPALRVMLNKDQQDDDAELCDAQVIKREGSLEDQQGGEDLGGLAPAHKLNKATILSKATEYISHLERKNQALADENASLKGRVEGFEMMMMSRGDERDCLWA